jgi:hypothetical protein
VNHIQKLPREQRRAAAKYLLEQSKRYPAHLIPVPRDEWEPSQNVIEFWRSRDYAVQVYKESNPGIMVRLSINRTRILPSGDWQADIPWEDMQRLKAEAGYGQFDAVEVFPADCDVVNVANMRHLWVIRGSISFAWRQDEH